MLNLEFDANLDTSKSKMGSSNQEGVLEVIAKTNNVHCNLER